MPPAATSAATEASRRSSRKRLGRIGRIFDIAVAVHVQSGGASYDDKPGHYVGKNATGNYVKIVQRIPVKIVLEPGENQDHQLRPGMNVVPDVYIR